jgi:hypothetical protein
MAPHGRTTLPNHHNFSFNFRFDRLWLILGSNANQFAGRANVTNRGDVPVSTEGRRIDRHSASLVCDCRERRSALSPLAGGIGRKRNLNNTHPAEVRLSGQMTGPAARSA